VPVKGLAAGQRALIYDRNPENGGTATAANIEITYWVRFGYISRRKMSVFNLKFLNFMQYFGFQSTSYYHSDAPANYDADDPLAYYIDHSPRSFFEGQFDPEGLPLYSHQGRGVILTVHNILYALGSCEQFRQTKNELNRQNFLKVAGWLVKTQDENGGWKSEGVMPKFGLHRPFYSSMIQGMAISTLVRAAQLTGQNNFIECALKALRLFQIEVTSGGVSRTIDGQVFYEEYPSEKKHHVLNGFIYSIWGLLDLIRYNDNALARQLWEEGLNTLSQWLPQYDMGYWSLYHIGEGLKNPATIPYHKLHIEQLRAMYEITGQKIFQIYAEKWAVYLNGPFNALKTLPQKMLWNLARGL